jgi:hypothetical protein
MTKEERELLITKYAEGYDEVARSLEGIAPLSLSARPIEGKWSAAEIVHHLADSEMTSAMRLRLLISQDNAVIYGYDQDVFSERLHYNGRDIGPSLEAFRGARASTVQVLRGMSEGEWNREGWHTESGRYSTEKWLEIYASHAHNHAAQIRRLNDMLSLMLTP